MCTFLRLQSAEEIAKCKSFVRPCRQDTLALVVPLNSNTNGKVPNVIHLLDGLLTPPHRSSGDFFASCAPSHGAVGIYAHICVFLVFAVAIG